MSLPCLDVFELFLTRVAVSISYRSFYLSTIVLPGPIAFCLHALVCLLRLYLEIPFTITVDKALEDKKAKQKASRKGKTGMIWDLISKSLVERISCRKTPSEKAHMVQHFRTGEAYDPELQICWWLGSHELSCCFTKLQFTTRHLGHGGDREHRAIVPLLCLCVRTQIDVLKKPYPSRCNHAF